MTMTKSEFEHRQLGEAMVATARFVLARRDDLPAIIGKLKLDVPKRDVVGPAFSIIQFVTSVRGGLDVEVGFPVSREVESGEVRTKIVPAMEVLSFVHRGPLADLGASYRRLYDHAHGHGLISDEFCREVYLELEPDGVCTVEIQFVVHRWDGLLAANLRRVLGEDAERRVMRGIGALTAASPVEDRFTWVKGAVERLESLADEKARYDIMSRCAHVFPARQIEKLRSVYETAKETTGDAMEAVDSVLAFMEEDPGWGEKPRREGRIISSCKKPRDPTGFEKAQTELERKKAYCYCPLVRENLDEGMPPTFCYCGAGWYRQQWEGALGRPVTIEVVSSLLKGDDHCEFAIHLPEDLS